MKSIGKGLSINGTIILTTSAVSIPMIKINGMIYTLPNHAVQQVRRANTTNGISPNHTYDIINIKTKEFRFEYEFESDINSSLSHLREKCYVESVFSTQGDRISHSIDIVFLAFGDKYNGKGSTKKSAETKTR